MTPFGNAHGVAPARMENDYDRSEDDAWHGRIAAGRILSVLAAERLRAPRARTPAAARGAALPLRSGTVSGVCGTGGGTKNAKPEVMFVKGEHKYANIKRSERYEKLRCPRGLMPLHGPREAPRGRAQTGHPSVAAVTCGVVTGRTARGAVPRRERGGGIATRVHPTAPPRRSEHSLRLSTGV